MYIRIYIYIYIYTIIYLYISGQIITTSPTSLWNTMWLKNWNIEDAIEALKNPPTCPTLLWCRWLPLEKLKCCHSLELSLLLFRQLNEHVYLSKPEQCCSPVRKWERGALIVPKKEDGRGRVLTTSENVHQSVCIQRGARNQKQNGRIVWSPGKQHLHKLSWIQTCFVHDIRINNNSY